MTTLARAGIARGWNEASRVLPARSRRTFNRLLHVYRWPLLPNRVIFSLQALLSVGPKPSELLCNSRKLCRSCFNPIDCCMSICPTDPHSRSAETNDLSDCRVQTIHWPPICLHTSYYVKSVGRYPKSAQLLWKCPRMAYQVGGVGTKVSAMGYKGRLSEQFLQQQQQSQAESKPPYH